MKGTPKADALRQMREANFAARQKPAKAIKPARAAPKRQPAAKPSPAATPRRQ